MLGVEGQDHFLEGPSGSEAALLFGFKLGRDLSRAVFLEEVVGRVVVEIAL